MGGEAGESVRVPLLLHEDGHRLQRHGPAGARLVGLSAMRTRTTLNDLTRHGRAAPIGLLAESLLTLKAPRVVCPGARRYSTL